MNQKDGLRWNTAKAFLRPAMNRPNLTLWTHTQTEKLLFDGRRASALRVHRRDGAAQTVTARREIILSAGSIGSPQILELSGVGQGELLAARGIETLHALPLSLIHI